MIQVIAKNRPLSKTTTNLIPVGRISPNDLYERTVPRKVFVDPSIFLTDCGTPTLPIPESPEPPNTSMRTMQAAFGSGQSHLAALKKAQRELLNVDRAALQVFIGFSQAAGTSITAAASTFAPDVIVSFPGGLLVGQMKTTKESVADELPAFYEPITFGWTKKASQIRQAAKRYSENTHADY